MKIKNLLIPVVASLVYTSIASASHLAVVNENKKELKVKIEPEGDSSASFSETIPADEFSSIELNSSKFNGKSYYSIKGDTSAFTPGGKCEHLSIDKNYKITFQNDKVGTTCIAEEATPLEVK